jgi:hypothetical protein
LAPEGAADPGALAEALRATVLSPAVSAVTTRQQEDGMWGANFLAFHAAPRDGAAEPGTVAQFRRLVQLGVPTSTRPFRLASRVLFRTLSRDDDPALYGEFFDATVDDPDAAEWCRNLIREGAAAALAEAGHQDDPRLRGVAHKIISQVSAFLRSELADQPLVKHGTSWHLHPEAAPPSWWSVAMLASMPSLQRERAGFVERLGQYLAQKAPDKTFSIAIGSTTMRPTHLLLGDPIEADAKGNAKDVPLALHFIELLAGLGLIAATPRASLVLGRLLADCDASGVWHPKNLRSQPKPHSAVTHHSWPLAPDDGDLVSRQADVTFRLALIARRLGWSLEYA